MRISETDQRSRSSKFFGMGSLLILASLMLGTVAVREWHAWQGHRAFLQKRFLEASAHLRYVTGGASLYAFYFRVPAFAHLYAQTLLVLDRDEEAIQEYRSLLGPQADSPIPAYVIATYDWARGNSRLALEHLEKTGQCNRCRESQQLFLAAVQGNAALADLSRQQSALVEKMVLPAQCFAFRSGSAIVNEILDRATRYLDRAISIGRGGSSFSRQAAWQARELLRRLLHDALNSALDTAQQFGDSFTQQCSPQLKLYHLLKYIPVLNWFELREIDSYIDHFPHVPTAKSAATASVHLYELGELGVKYAQAYRAHAEAKSAILTADEHAKTMWRSLKAEAREPNFLTGAASPERRHWLSSIVTWVSDINLPWRLWK